MPRTTINIDATVLAQLKKRSRLEGKSIDEIVSEVLARNLSHADQDPGRLEWATRKMGARFDLGDGEHLRDVLDEE
ncbi:MAG TPA: hypothetical protein VMO47_03725 [Rhodothermales bacterium]|nr:hypothetical protein [Rhodothermales bacterium]